MFGLKLTNMSNFYPLGVVGRVSETQLQASKIKTNVISRIRVNYNTETVRHSDKHASF